MRRPSRLTVAAAITGMVVAACAPGSPRATDAAPGSGATGSPSPRIADPNDLDVSTSGWRTDFTRASIDYAEIISGGPGKDGIPAIDQPEYESIGDAREWLTDRSPVIALEIDGHARGYPLAVLMWHEIVNDVLAGRPIVVTFCPLCNTALVFERQLGDVTYDFGTTGNLRFSDLVMYDRQTESWWQQATGQAIVGELTGTQLTFLPAQIVSLADFAAAHPDGDLLSRRTGHNRRYGSNPYLGYDTVDQDPFLFIGEVDGRLPPKERVVTVGRGDESTAFPYSELRKVGVAEGELAGDPYVVFWAPGTASALDGPMIDDSEDIGATGVYRTAVDGRRLTFALDGDAGLVRDHETGSTWSVTGVAVDGPLDGSRLEPVVHGDHFWFAWAAFAPETTIWTAG
jgi:hypothetical protein